MYSNWSGMNQFFGVYFHWEVVRLVKLCNSRRWGYIGRPSLLLSWNVRRRCQNFQMKVWVYIFLQARRTLRLVRMVFLVESQIWRTCSTFFSRQAISSWLDQMGSPLLPLGRRRYCTRYCTITTKCSRNLSCSSPRWPINFKVKPFFWCDAWWEH